MRSALRNIIVAAGLVFPALAFAQSGEALTRAQVHAHLVQLEQAGYDPYAKEWLYPDGLKQAEKKVAEQQAAENTAYGPESNGTVQSGN